MLTSKIWLVWIFCFSFLTYFQPCTSSGCSPVSLEEGTKGTISCDLSTDVRNLTWKLERNGAFITLLNCSSQSGCINVQNFSASLVTNGTTSRSVLQIAAINRNESKFKCVADEGLEEVECNVQVYVKPEWPSCGPPVAVSTSDVTVSCNTTRVYPSALCVFYLMSHMMPPQAGYVSYLSTPPATPNGDVATTCTLHLNTTGLAQDNYTYSLYMFPKANISYLLSGMANITISLRAPTAARATDCPNGPSIKAGYIDARYGSNTTCRCELVDRGVPLGQASWFSSSGSIIGVTNVTDRSSSLTLTYASKDPNPSYTCRATTVLNVQANEVNYSPNYAAGPNAVTIDLSDLTFNLCPSNNQNVTVTCKVAVNQVNPGTTFSVLVDSQVAVLSQKGSMPSLDYVFSYAFRPQIGGSSSITCRAENSLFSDVRAETTARLSVQEPPKTAPKILTLVQGIDTTDQKAPITEGSNLAVVCLVEGGIPRVQSVALQCGDKKDEAKGNRASLSMTATKSLSGQVCHCSSVHVTGCYTQTSELILVVTAGSSGKTEPVSQNLIIGVAVGGGAVVLIIVVVVIVVLRRRREAPKTPNYAAEWTNSKSDYLDTMSTYTIGGSPRYVAPPSYPPPETPKESDYSEIYPTSDYLISDEECPYPLSGPYYNGAIKGDYFEPIG